MTNEISLFVMQGCSICPQMERLFHAMHKNGAISALEVIDVSQNPEVAQQYNIRSVPFYLINGVAFSGLKSQQEILNLLQQDELEKWRELLKQELSGGQLDAAEEAIMQNVPAREAMMALLGSRETELVVRIGLSAIIESLTEGTLLLPYEQEFIHLAGHEDERIAVDALYYLSLLATPRCLQTLIDISKTGRDGLRQHALELLHESSSDQVLH